uniref:Heat shock protein n=1 Tax=Phenacoccus solenopsis TaxID=483260 RepID=A0A097PHM9_9HEMI|nr:heat shock protein [Phenacoccus solenopsis]
MAKWGEGDPRWIVEERPDATNVNNWHWTEKNACQWSQDTLKKLLVGLEIEGDHFRCVITDLDKCQGEAVVNNRKGKLIFFYEWDIVASWQGKVRGKEETIEGKVAIPNLSEENDISEVDISFSLKENSDTGSLLKEFLYNDGASKVREQLRVYLRDLKEEFSKGLILPKKDEADSKTCKDQINNLSSKFDKKITVNNAQADKQQKNIGVKIATKTLTTSQSFQCTGPELYNALTQMELVTAFTNGPVKMEVKEGGKFELFGGNIHGTFLELVPNKKIVQRWRTKRWPAEHYSTVTITIEQQNDDTTLNLVQTGVPDNEFEGTKDNWDRYYWDAIKRTLGYGSFII